jgi:hypothetical protein
MSQVYSRAQVQVSGPPLGPVTERVQTPRDPELTVDLIVNVVLPVELVAVDDAGRVGYILATPS